MAGKYLDEFKMELRDRINELGELNGVSGDEKALVKKHAEYLEKKNYGGRVLEFPDPKYEIIASRIVNWNEPFYGYT